MIVPSIAEYFDDDEKKVLGKRLYLGDEKTKIRTFQKR